MSKNKNIEAGCPYSRFNWSEMFEKCILTDKITEGNADCDYSFDDCPAYQKAVAAGVPIPPHEPIPSAKQLEKVLLI